jgi:2-polyprenyl-3-methyl-5-hydroxy-6-metoxy-1,4-benzoquinol methylase
MNDYKKRLSLALQEEHQSLLDLSTNEFKQSSIEVLDECPVCQTNSSTVYCVKDQFVHKRCSLCGLVYLDPKLSREATLRFYNSHVNEIYNEEKFHKRDSFSPDDLENYNNYQLVLQNAAPVQNKRLLEIGPGKGTFLAKAVNDGFEAHAVELNEKLIENLKKITPYVYSDDIQNIEMANDFFDVIYFRDVMEHIDSAIPFLNTIKKILKPGGTLIIDTHNINSIVNSMTKEFHTVIFPFEHPVHWSPKSLTYACEKVGLTLKSKHFDHKHQSFAEIVTYIINPSFTYIYPPKRSSISFLIYRILNRLLQVPIIKGIDGVVSVMLSKLLGRGSKMQMIFTKK